MDYRNEVYRKLIHYALATIPICYFFFFDRTTILWILGVMTGSIIIGEILRMRFVFFRRLYKLILGKVVRIKEDHTFTGATFSLLGTFITILIFEKYVAMFAVLVLALADSTAALVGRKLGRIPFLGKTVEGTGAFLLIAILLAMFSPELPRTGALLGALIATIVELLPSPMNDNIMIPLSAAITLSMVNLVT